MMYEGIEKNEITHLLADYEKCVLEYAISFHEKYTALEFQSAKPADNSQTAAISLSLTDRKRKLDELEKRILAEEVSRPVR
ncbi:MAG: hypothetical protein P8Z77_12690 [Candidatus Thiodiazotropha sp.]